MRHQQNALQRVAGDADLLAVARQQVLKRLGGVVDLAVCVVLDLANGPVPHPRQHEQPTVEQRLLGDVDAQLELGLDHGLDELLLFDLYLID